MQEATTLTERRVHHRRITVDVVRDVLREIAAEEPDRCDARTELESGPRYIHSGHPSCLVARVLYRLGFSAGVLRAMDREYPTGELVEPGARIAESRHPALRKIDPTAKQLLQWVQDKQDQGLAWGVVVRQAFDVSRLSIWAWDRRRRPWLYI